MDPDPGNAADRAFARYRASRDPTDLAEVFDRTAPRLILVAMHLVRDAGEAEDLLQTTFLEAMRRASSFDPRRPVLPWLLTILWRRAANRRRDESRRKARGEIDTGIADRSPGPADSLERKDVLEQVTSALERLSHPYREVLVLRLVHGLRPIEIARALDRPPGTVHAQLHRGMDLLRRALPEGLAVPGALLLCEGSGLAAVRSELLAAAARPAATTTLGATAGGAIMKKLMAAAVAVLAVTMLGLWWNASKTPVMDVGEGDNALAIAEDPDTEDPAAGSGAIAAEQGAARHEREAIAGDERPDGAPGALMVKVRDDRGWPLASVAVDVIARDGRDPLFATWRGATAGDGEAWFRDLIPGRYAWQAPGLDARQVEVRAGKTTAVELVVEPGGTANVQVLHADGSPAGGAEVWSYHGRLYGENDLQPPSILSGRRVACADAAGRCRIHGLHVTRRRLESGGSYTFVATVPWLAARLGGYRPSPLTWVGPCGAGEERSMVLRLGVPGCAVDGLVVDEQDLPVRGAAVELRLPLPHLRETGNGWQLERYGATTTTDRGGRFVMEGLLAGPAEVRVMAPGHAPHEVGISLDPASSPLSITVRLRAGAEVAGRVSTTDGQGLAGARVTIARRGVSTGVEGTFHVAGLMPGSYDYVVRADGFAESCGVLDCAAGDALQLDVVLEPLALVRGVVADAAGNGLPGWKVWAENVEDSRDVRTATSGAPDGAFEVAVLPRKDYRLSVREPETAGRIRFPSVGNIRGGGDPVVLSVADDRRATAFLTGYLLESADRPVGPARFSVRIAGEWWIPQAEHDLATGGFRVGPIPPGECELRIGSAERAFPGFRAGPFSLASHETRDLGRLVPPPTGVLEVRIDGPDLDLDSAYLDIVTGEEHHESILHQERVQGQRTLRVQVRAGSHRVRLWGDTVLTVEQPVELPPGEETEVVLEPQHGRRRGIVLALPEGEQRAEVDVRAAGGRLVYSHVLTAAEPTVTRQPVFGAGRHFVEAVGGSGRRYHADFVVDLSDLTKLRPELRPR